MQNDNGERMFDRETRTLMGVLVAVWFLFMLGMCFVLYEVGYDKGYEEGAEPATYEAGVEVVVNVNVTAGDSAEEIVDTQTETRRSLGEFKLTGYCPCEKCCGVNTGITATGTKATAGRTIGVNPSVIPYGSIVEINGHKYIAEDTGSAIGKKHIDIYFNTHEEAQAFGVQKAEVFIIEEVEE